VSYSAARGAVLVLGLATLVAAGTAAPSTAAPPASPAWQAAAWERATLAPNDGWAAAGAGTTGGADADRAHTFTVRTWQQLRDALGGSGASPNTNATPTLIRVKGTINANDKPDGTRSTCADYADPDYSFEEFLATYDPAVWGTATPVGPLEDARKRSQANQAAQVRHYVGSNVTIVGADRNARIVGANLQIRAASNVIVRNLTLSDAYDCFPAWSPADAGGTWNSEYDNLWLYGATNVWVDHVTFDDGEHPPSSLPHHLGAKYEVHDGLLDITNASDLVTVSYNRFEEHDKTSLVGSSNTRYTDRGKLRVTYHHNLWIDQGQRLPRVRFGDVHLYDNHYVYSATEAAATAVYAWGVGVESRIVAQQNVFSLAAGQDPANLIADWGGLVIEASGTLVLQPLRPPRRVDLVGLYNATHDPDLSADAGWTPTLHGRIDPAWTVPVLVGLRAGAGRIGAGR
jgi:pectate lyase